MAEKTYIVTQTEQFRVRADSEEEACERVAEQENGENVEWMACIEREATQVKP